MSPAARIAIAPNSAPHFRERDVTSKSAVLTPELSSRKAAPPTTLGIENGVVTQGGAFTTASPVIHEEAQGEYDITLTVTQPTTTYTTTVLLGDTYPSSFTTSASDPSSGISSPGLHSADIVGIVVGVVGGLAVLIGVFYVYLLRARYLKRVRMRGRRKKRSGSSGAGSGSGSGSGGDAAPGPPPEAAPA